MANEERFVLNPNKKLKMIKKLRISLKAGLSEEKLSLMPCLITLSNVLF